MKQHIKDPTREIDLNVKVKRLLMRLRRFVITFLTLCLIQILAGCATPGSSVGSADPKSFKAEEALWQAAHKGNLNAVKELLAGGVNIESRSGPELWTPLIYAATSDHLDIVQYLVEHGAQVDAQVLAVTFSDIKRDGIETVGKYHLVPNVGVTALARALNRGHSDIANYLIANGASQSLNVIYKSAHIGTGSFAWQTLVDMTRLSTLQDDVNGLWLSNGTFRTRLPVKTEQSGPAGEVRRNGLLFD